MLTWLLNTRINRSGIQIREHASVLRNTANFSAAKFVIFDAVKLFPNTFESHVKYAIVHSRNTQVRTDSAL